MPARRSTEFMQALSIHPYHANPGATQSFTRDEKMDYKKKILVIDDDKDFGLALKYFFADKNFELLVAHTLTQGMIMLEQEKPDYVFLDNSLPDGLGWGKTEFILSHYPQTHLNLVSALDVPKTSASTFRILEKPVSLEEIMSCLA